MISGTTDQLDYLQGHAITEQPTRGREARVWAADITVVNPDGTVDAQPVFGRATKVGVQVPSNYAPAVGDRVLCADLGGDPRLPIVIGALSTTKPTVTGSKGGNAALGSLLDALEAMNLIIDQTT